MQPDCLSIKRLGLYSWIYHSGISIHLGPPVFHASGKLPGRTSAAVCMLQASEAHMRASAAAASLHICGGSGIGMSAGPFEVSVSGESLLSREVEFCNDPGVV